MHRLALVALFFFSLVNARATAQIPEAEYAARRDSLAAHMGDGVLLALGSVEPEEDYLTFEQSPRFLYLTGLREPNATLVMVKRGGRVTQTMFVDPRDPAREAWVGERLGPAGVARRTGMNARPAGELATTLDSLLGDARTLWVVGDIEAGRVLSRDAQQIEQLRQTYRSIRVESANGWVDALRSRHSAPELALLRRAAEITVAAQRAAMRDIAPGRAEYEVQALIEYTFRRSGADRPGFATIVGSGPNSTALHHDAGERRMQRGDVVVMDIGASYRGYSADVTRTVPVSGTFSPEQRALYRVVRAAQAAAERAARVGGSMREMDEAANAVLTGGLARLGLIESDSAVYDPGRGGCRRRLANGCSQLSLWYIHALGHPIGLEVHDPGSGLILPGSAFTIEPGLYIRASVLDALPDTPRNRAMLAALRPVVARYRDIGIRIEDDYVATADGIEWISRAPRELEEIESGMRLPRESGITSP